MRFYQTAGSQRDDKRDDNKPAKPAKPAKRILYIPTKVHYCIKNFN